MGPTPTRHAFRFTIGQGMAVIAVLAVLFAFLPMPAAIGMALLVTWLVVTRRKTSNPALAKTIGCLSCFLGFILGELVAVVLQRWPVNPDIETRIGLFFGCGYIGATLGGITGHLIAWKRFGGPPSRPDPSEAKRQAVRSEVELVDRLLIQAEDEGDEEVRLKLAAYRAKLEQKLHDVE